MKITQDTTLGELENLLKQQGISHLKVLALPPSTEEAALNQLVAGGFCATARKDAQLEFGAGKTLHEALDELFHQLKRIP